MHIELFLFYQFWFYLQNISECSWHRYYQSGANYSISSFLEVIVDEVPSHTVIIIICLCFYFMCILVCECHMEVKFFFLTFKKGRCVYNCFTIDDSPVSIAVTYQTILSLTLTTQHLKAPWTCGYCKNHYLINLFERFNFSQYWRINLHWTIRMSQQFWRWL